MKITRHRRSPLPIVVLWHTADVAEMLHVPKSLLDGLIRNGDHPPYVWKRHWPEPKWTDRAVTEWAGILADIDLDSLLDDPPPLVHPATAFRPRSRGAA